MDKIFGKKKSTNDVRKTDSLNFNQLKAKTSEIIDREIEEQVREIFETVDRNNDGVISEEGKLCFVVVAPTVCLYLELKHAIRKFKKQNGVIGDALKLGQFEIKNGERINFQTFLSIIKSTIKRFNEAKSNNNPEVREMFSFFANKEEQITSQELKAKMNSLGIEIDDAQTAEMIHDADVNRDGKIDQNEFRRVLELYAESFKK